MDLRLLLLEDNPDDAELVLYELGRAGFNPIARRVDTREAFQEALSPDLDVILSDFELPNFDALQALELAREVVPSVPFIIVSGVIREETAVEAMKSGAADYLLKDRLARLGSAVEHALEARRIEEEKEAAYLRLKESEERFAGIFHRSLTLIAVTDADDGKFLEANQFTLERLGYTRDELIGKTALELGMWENVEQRSELVARLGKEESIRDAEVTLRDRSGKPVWLRCALVPIAFGDRNGLLWIGIDVTARKEVSEALENERLFLNSVIDNIPISVFVKNAETLEFVRFNRASEDLMGYPREDLLGKTVQQLFSHNEAERITRQDRRVLDTGELLEIPEETFHSYHNGTRILHTRKIPIRAADGSARYLLGITEDITDLKEYEKALIEARDRAEEMSRLKGAFLTNMSHEIRTPLSGIIGFANVLADEVTGEQREHAVLIKECGERLLDTFNSVLDLSMVEAGTLKLDLEVLDVGTLVRETAETLRAGAERKRLDFRTVVAPTNVIAVLDRKYLIRIVQNLIGNAVKFTDEGSVAVIVRANEGVVEIEVRDTGAGISPEFRPLLFEAFEQESAGRARSHEGSGLGLAIAKHLIEAMQGTISVESRKGHGSSFTVSFPRLMIEKNDPPSDTGRLQERKEKEKRGSGLRVLAVDDFAPMRFLLTRYLQEIGEVSNFDVAESDSEALALAATNQYDVVLMDINLKCPRDGEQVMNEMRRLPSYADVPFVAVTAYALTEDRDRYLASGFADYLAKPVKQDQVRSTLLSSLGIRDLPRPVLVPAGTPPGDSERFMGQKTAS